MKQNAEKIIKEKLKQEPFKEIIEIINQVADGDIFLVGGFIYRTLISNIYQRDAGKSDLDFVVIGKIKEKELSRFEEHSKHNKYEGFRVSHRGLNIDICEMKSQYHIKKHNLQPTLKNYFDCVPLTIQAIAFDIKNNVILEQNAFDAIIRQEVIINNTLIDSDWLNKKATKKAEELGFIFKK